ncbi:hypothetical protein [Enterobacter sp. PGRG2]|uniref:hypothetical protein n=1 Tax=Enterobacter sp. PGRG2 TaxID=3104013 RepID=UPI002ABD415C|nr:hypothetical protein [Enterobacter sp. PGRG2]WJD47902.1 hypothetical protein QRD42_11345 [Enterobacter sp. PGRG2]
MREMQVFCRVALRLPGLQRTCRPGKLAPPGVYLFPQKNVRQHRYLCDFPLRIGYACLAYKTQLVFDKQFIAL